MNDFVINNKKYIYFDNVWLNFEMMYNFKYLIIRGLGLCSLKNFIIKMSC